MAELKPCPKCGKSPCVDRQWHRNEFLLEIEWRYRCYCCDYCTPWQNTYEESIEEWNRRFSNG
ncbi:MAG: hypothetical protein IKW45_05420 [Clostridia bacterium]|nr:hypothetical protein [Clostridia bacterium]